MGILYTFICNIKYIIVRKIWKVFLFNFNSFLFFTHIFYHRNMYIQKTLYKTFQTLSDSNWLPFAVNFNKPITNNIVSSYCIYMIITAYDRPISEMMPICTSDTLTYSVIRWKNFIFYHFFMCILYSFT